MTDATLDKMVEENSDRWMAYLRGSSVLQIEGARREADNERARENLVKLDDPKAYDLRLKAEAANTV